MRISIVYLNSEYQITTFQNEEEIGISISSKIKFAGIEFKSPIGVTAMGFPLGAEVPPEMHAEVILKHAQAGQASLAHLDSISQQIRQ